MNFLKDAESETDACTNYLRAGSVVAPCRLGHAHESFQPPEARTVQTAKSLSFKPLFHEKISKPERCKTYVFAVSPFAVILSMSFYAIL